MLAIADKDIGGARVRRTFSRGSVYLKAGGHLSADEVLAIPIANRRALADAGYIEIYPKSPQRAVKSERFIVSVGKDRHDVIEGERLNDKPLARDAAERLAYGD